MIDAPIVQEIDDSLEELSSLKARLGASDVNLLFLSPTVYIHNWKYNDYIYDAYVGEANDVFSRTRQHFQSDEDWHQDWKRPHDKKKMFVIGHPHFNKSLTLDVENRLMHYMSCMRSVHRLRNGRGNPQNNYYPRQEFDGIFHLIWEKLHKANPELFVSEQTILDSALFKCSPLQRLSPEQMDAKREILEVIRRACKSKKQGGLVVIEGEAGTGKSVLMSSLFYDLVAPDGDRARDEGRLQRTELRCEFIINHNEQLANFNSIFRRLGLCNKEDIVVKPSVFINKMKKAAEGEKVDVAFIDEAHLLLTQGNQGYSGKNQLDDILKYAKTVVVIFDEHQILTREQYLEKAEIIKRRDEAKKKRFYYELKTQFRIDASEKTKAWIDSFSNDCKLLPIPRDASYDLRIFDDVGKMYAAIKAKAGKKSGRLSRVLASYDWAYNNTSKRKPDNYEVCIGAWHLPWNYETSRKFTVEDKKKIRDQAWAEQEHTIGEVGSTFTIQGFDLTYSGVILGPSISWDKRKREIVIKGSKSKNLKVTSRRTCKDGEKRDLAKYLVQHELRVLMTRGVKGMYIYACDNDLRAELLRLQEMREEAPDVLPDIGEDLRYKEYLPFYSLRAACGKFGDGEAVSPEGWVKVDGFPRKKDGWFVVRASGHSMEPEIHDDDLCVFRTPDMGSPVEKEGAVLLVQYQGVADPETGGAYSIKKYVSAASDHALGMNIALRPLNAEFDSMIFDENEQANLKLLAEFKGVIR